ncbi:MAG: hypothetical protein ABI263_04305 [Gelidibacter sp.]
MSPLQEGGYNLSDERGKKIDFVDLKSITKSAIIPPNLEFNLYTNEIRKVIIAKIERNIIIVRFKSIAFTADGKESCLI